MKEKLEKVHNKDINLNTMNIIIKTNNLKDEYFIIALKRELTSSLMKRCGGIIRK